MKTKRQPKGRCIEISIKWAQLASPRGEVRQGFWVLNQGTPIRDNACFNTKKEAKQWVRKSY